VVTLQVPTSIPANILPFAIINIYHNESKTAFQFQFI